MTSEQEALLRKARRSLHTAKLVADHQDWDFAASRAYYSMFYLAEALLLGKGLRYSSHGAVTAAFGEHFAKIRLLDPKLHRYLLGAQITRARDDYDAMLEVTEADARHEIAHAEEFLQAAESYLRSA